MKAIGLIRGRWWSGKWTRDHALQKRQMREFAEAEGYDLLAFYTFESNNTVVNRRSYKPFFNALQRSKRSKATVMYIDLGRWRRSPLLNDLLKLNAGAKRPEDGYPMICIPAERKTLEAIERHARFEKYAEINRSKKRRLKNQEPKKTVSPLKQWQKVRGIMTRRLNNFKHLYEGVSPIYQLFNKWRGEAMVDIADHLNANYYLTVDGRRWTRHNVQKTLDIIRSQEFDEYVELREEAVKAI